MDLRRLRAGEWIAAVSAAVLLVSLFLPWYARGDERASAWESFAAIDLVLALVGLAGVALLPVTASQRVPAVPIAFTTLLTLAALIVLVLVLVRVANPPGAADGREWGLWLGLVAAVGLVAGCAVAMRDERLSPPGRHTDLSGRPAPPPPEIEPTPAPRPE